MDSLSVINNLPKTIQQQIHVYLETDNFRAAKELYDRFIKFSATDKHTTPKPPASQLVMEDAS